VSSQENKSSLLEEELFYAQLKQTFLEEAAFLLEDVEEAMLTLDAEDQRDESLARIFRAAHSVKGSAASVGFTDLAAFAHIAEDCLSVLRAQSSLVRPDIVSLLLDSIDALKARVQSIREDESVAGKPWDVRELTARLKAVTAELTHVHVHPEKTEPEPYSQSFGFFDDEPPVHAAADTDIHGSSPVKGSAEKSGKIAHTGSQVLKIDAERVESVLQLVSQLVVLKSQLELDQGASAHKSTAFVSLDKVVRELYDRALSMRMNSLKQLFVKMQRTIRDISTKIGKPVDFVMEGEDTELDRGLIEQIGDPLVHLIRNAIDHGIEASAERMRKGKGERGHIALRAFRRGSSVVIEISDDGGGINPAKIVAKAIEKKLITEDAAASLTPRQINGLLFLAGFSTAASVTDLSGRGVGLDVVKSNVEAVKGHIEIDSVLDQGSTFRVILPLTAAIMSGVVVEVGEEKYIVPMEAVQEFIKLKDGMLKGYGGSGQLLYVRGHYCPITHLGTLMNTPGSQRGETALLLESGGNRLGIIVDRVLGISQVVLKSVRNISSGGVIAGAAVLGDGRVAPVLDVPSLVAVIQESVAA